MVSTREQNVMLAAIIIVLSQLNRLTTRSVPWPALYDVLLRRSLQGETLDQVADTVRVPGLSTSSSQQSQISTARNSQDRWSTEVDPVESHEDTAQKISDRDGSLSVFSTATAHTYKEQSQQGGNDTATGPAPVSAQPTAKNNSPVVVSHTPEKHFAHSRSEDENPSREQTSIAASAAPRRRLQNKKQRRFFSKSYSGVRKLSSTKKALNIYNNNRRHNYVAALQALATTKEVRDLIEVSTEAPSSSSPMLDPAPQADVRLADDAKVVPHVQRWCDPIQDHSTGVKDLELHFRGLSVADPVDALAEQFSALCITPSDPVDAIFEDFWGLSITGRRSWCSEASKAEKPVWSDCLAPKFEIEDVEMSGLDPEDETNSRRLPQRPSEGFLRDVMTDGTEETKVVLHTWWSPTLIAPGQDVTMGGT